MPLWDTVKSVGGSIGGGLVSGVFGAVGRSKQASASRKEAARNREWQERMSSTAYQRATKDMRKAGINPILAYRQGGASTPGGAMAQIPDFGALGSDISNGMSVGSRLAESESNVQSASESRANMREQRRAIGAGIDLTQAQARKALQESQTSAMQAKLIGTENLLKMLQVPGASVDASIDSSSAGEVYKHMQKGGPAGAAMAAGAGGLAAGLWKAIMSTVKGKAALGGVKSGARFRSSQPPKTGYKAVTQEKIEALRKVRARARERDKHYK